MPLLDAGAPPPPGVRPAGWPESRGWRWVRSNPIFVSGLTVRMGAPPRAEVDRYFDDFAANAVHLWETALPDELQGWRAMRPDARWLTWVHTDGTVVGTGQVIGGIEANLPGRIGYQIGDEPRTREAWEETLRGVAAVAAADPEGLRIINYTYGAEEIDAFLREHCERSLADVVSYDHYTRGNSSYENLMRFRNAAQRCGQPYWRYIKSYGTDRNTATDMRWDAFSGLVYGYTGHSWFLYQVRDGAVEEIPTTLFDRSEEWGATPTAAFRAAAQINRELQVYGRAMTQLHSTDIGWVATVSLPGLHPPDGAPTWRRDMDPYLDAVEVAGSFEDALIGFFVDVAGDRYVMVQNPSHAEGSFPTDTDDDLDVTLRFDFAGAPVDPTHVLQLDGRTGEVRPRPLSGDALPLTIAPGDVFFFKYDTGRPFAGY